MEKENIFLWMRRRMGNIELILSVKQGTPHGKEQPWLVLRLSGSHHGNLKTVVS